MWGQLSDRLSNCPASPLRNYRRRLPRIVLVTLHRACWSDHVTENCQSGRDLDGLKPLGPDVSVGHGKGMLVMGGQETTTGTGIGAQNGRGGGWMGEAHRWTAIGSSHEPGTDCSTIFDSFTPHSRSLALVPASKGSMMVSFQRA
jgi:hypothetical protein